MAATKGLITNIQRFQLHDGPGIRTIVFVKGCPLRCAWCCNPETQNTQPEVMLDRSQCIKCGRCVTVCPLGANKLVDGEIVMDRSLCQGRGVCVEGCPVSARKLAGYYVTVQDVIEVVKKDTLFYRNSDGGVTVSGGEPTAQPEFVAELLDECQKHGFHTAVETCGYAARENMLKVVEHADLVLYDIKHMDSTLHKEVTGVSNDLVLSNARMIVDNGAKVVLRIPLITDFNDTEENIRQTAKFARDLDHNMEGIDLLPLHKFGMGKYEKLGRQCEWEGITPEQDELDKLKAVIESEGVRAETF